LKYVNLILFEKANVYNPILRIHSIFILKKFLSSQTPLYTLNQAPSQIILKIHCLIQLEHLLILLLSLYLLLLPGSLHFTPNASHCLFLDNQKMDSRYALAIAELYENFGLQEGNSPVVSDEEDKLNKGLSEIGGQTNKCFSPEADVLVQLMTRDGKELRERSRTLHLEEAALRRKIMKDWDRERYKRRLSEQKEERLRIEDLTRRRKYKPRQERKKPVWDDSPSVIAMRKTRFKLLVRRWRMQYLDKKRREREKDDSPPPSTQSPPSPPSLPSEMSAFAKGKRYNKKMRNDRDSKISMMKMLAAEKKLEEIYEKLGQKKKCKVEAQASLQKDSTEASPKKDAREEGTLLPKEEEENYKFTGNRTKLSLHLPTNFKKTTTGQMQDFKWSSSLNTDLKDANNKQALAKKRIHYHANGDMKNTTKPKVSKTIKTRWKPPPPLNKE